MVLTKKKQNMVVDQKQIMVAHIPYRGLRKTFNDDQKIFLWHHFEYFDIS